jgi:acetyl-CoA carboxylase biotin carboxylase subunit
MGLKTEAKAIAAAAGVPCVPGSDGVVSSDAHAFRLARAIGYPVLIKAAAGGGGKGMRVCRDEAHLSAALQMAQNEAAAAFKNGSIYLEKFIDRPRHVEVQILADAQGNVVSCWDRDCSLQRRHQKLVEESPAPTLPADVRARLSEADVALARAAGYVNAGTCEFLVDAEHNFYFIEVNARIQVEHPVTEQVTGIDLVKQQIHIAAGELLPFRQQDVVVRGHAIECRINSEDAEHDFRPSPGRITAVRIPGGPGVRWDSHIQAGYTVPPYYDSLLGKLIVHAPTRLEAIAILRRALDELAIEGISTTIGLHRKIVRHPDFIGARVDTTWVERVLLAETARPGPR